MQETTPILKIDKPHFTIELFGNLLIIDLKGTAKNDIEEALENKPLLRETIGAILGIFVPLHIRLSHIDSVHKTETGKVTIKISLHRDIVLPLEPNEANKLVDKLNQLILEDKKKDLERIERIIKERKLRRMSEEEEEIERTPMVAGAYPEPPPEGVLEAEKEAQEHIEKEEQERQN